MMATGFAPVLAIASAPAVGALLGLAAARAAGRLARPDGVEPRGEAWPPLPAGAAALGGALLAPPAVLLLPPGAWPAAALLLALLIAIAWLDLAEGVVHAALAAPLALGGLGFAALAAPDRLPAALAGLALGYLLFRAVEAGFRRLRGQEGLGRGDAWVLGAAGAWVGPGGIGPLVALAALAGLLGAAALRGGLPDRGASLPFAPALAIAAWLVWLCGGGAASWAL